MHQPSHTMTARIVVVTIALLCQNGIAMGAENDRAVVAASLRDPRREHLQRNRRQEWLEKR